MVSQSLIHLYTSKGLTLHQPTNLQKPFKPIFSSNTTSGLSLTSEEFFDCFSITCISTLDAGAPFKNETLNNKNTCHD